MIIMKFIKPLLFLFILIISFSCQKTTFKKTFTVTVKDSATGRGITDCKVNYRQENGGGYYFTEILSEDAYTDENGIAEFKFKPFKNNAAGDIRFLATIEGQNFKNKYHIGTVIISVSEVEKKNNIDIITSRPPGFMIIDIYEDYPNTDSTLFISSVNGEWVGGECHGSDCHSQLNIVTEGNKFNHIIWGLKKDNDVGSKYEDSIYVPAFETVNYIIIF